MRKKINQLNKNQSIAITCYRYAPESITAYIRVENPHSPNIPAYYCFNDKDEKDILRAVKEQGYNFVCGKHKEVYDAIKRAIRKHNKPRQLYFTYGFKFINDEKAGVYCTGSYFFEKVGANQETKKALLERIKKALAEKEWKCENYISAELGAGYKIEKVKNHYQSINPLKPYTIYSY